MSSKNRTAVIALAGNPNVGKTTLFNALTGARQHVGNWPGVTVEYKAGTFLHRGKEYEVIDLPGIYSLSASSPDERVARDFIMKDKPDLVVNIVDASNLERNLYLSVQLMEMQVPVVMVLSMTDIAERNGIRTDHKHLESHLGCPVIPLILNRKFDREDFAQRIDHCLQSSPLPNVIHYDEPVEKAITGIIEVLKGDAEQSIEPISWRAIKLIEGDADECAKLSTEQMDRISRSIHSVERHRGQDGRIVIADDRYAYIRGLVKDVVKRSSADHQTFSDRIDKVLLSKIMGLPVFFGVMYLVFLIAVRASQPLIGLIDGGLSWLLVDQFGVWLAGLSTPEWLEYILVEGLGGGLVTIAIFVPPIFFIFLSLAILEDSGYMARAAFIADKTMRRIGLPGKAFIPLLVGFGCTVPAIMATRTLESKRDRIMTSILTPFISCGAKLPVYTYLALIFFPRNADIAVFGLYISGIVMAMLVAFMLKKTLFKTDPGVFVMELPAFHVPTFNGIFLHTWHRLKEFILRAGKTILGVIILINIFQAIYITSPFESAVENGEPVKETLLQTAGRAINPVFEPMGIDHGNWEASVALLSGIFAKEAIVGSLQSLYGIEENEVGEATIKNKFGGTREIWAFLLFIVLYSPCAATLALLLKEFGRGWLVFAFGYLTLLAWVVATLFYQVSVWRAGSLLWIGICIGIIALSVYIFKVLGRKQHYETA